MRVRAGTLTDADRARVFVSNQEGRKLVIAATEGHVIRDDRGELGDRGRDEYVGSVTRYDYDNVYLGGFSFETRIPWEAIKGVWFHESAPPSKVVKAEFLGVKGYS